MDDHSPLHHTHAEHRHHAAKLNKPGRDLGMLGVLIHLIGDAINNIGVIIAAVVIWQTNLPQRFYADPAASTFIALMIFGSAIPLTLNSGKILLQSTPRGVEMDDVKHDLEQVRKWRESRLIGHKSFQYLTFVSARFRGSSPFTSYTYGAWTSKRPSHPPTLFFPTRNPWRPSPRRLVSSTSVCTHTASTRPRFSPRRCPSCRHPRPM